jgi:hypothetical protein
VIPEHTDDVGADEPEIAEELEEQQAQVLRREGLETELMDEDDSEEGEHISGVEVEE